MDKPHLSVGFLHLWWTAVDTEGHKDVSLSVSGKC